MKTEKQDSKSGGVLVMVMLVMLLFSILAIGLFQISGNNAVETVWVKQSKQAFWLAEAGLLDAINHINWDSDYRDDPWELTYDDGKGGGYTSVVLSIDTFSVPNVALYTIESVGAVQEINRRVQQEVSVRPGSKFTVTANGGDSTFNSNSEVNGGGVAVFDGSIDTGNNDTVNLGDYLYVSPEVSVTGDGVYEQQAMPESLQPPNFNPASYQIQIASVVSRGVATDSLSVGDSTTSSYDYTTNSVTFSSRLDVAADAVITSYGDIVFSRSATFQGPVTIEAGGDVILNQSSDLPAGSTIIAGGNVDIDGQCNVGSFVEIYSGANVIFGNQTDFNNRAIVYAEQDLSIASGGSSSVSGEGIAFLSNSSVTINSNMDPFRGIIYSNGSIEFNSNMDIYGTVVGELGFDADSNVDFYYELGAYEWVLDISGIGINFNDVLLTKGTWQELPPL